MFYKNKYHLGDYVQSEYDRDKIGHIKCIIEDVNNDKPSYTYLVLNENKKYTIEREGSLKLIKKMIPEEDSEKDKIVRSIIESGGYESDLKVGDIVRFRDGMIGEYVISSIIHTDHGEELYQYELANTYNGKSTYDKYCRCGRLMLKFQYHDANWEEYFTEGARQNELPPWRGNLYNFFMFFSNSDDVSLEPDAAVNVHEMEEFKDHTIPPIRMWHILRSHSIFARVFDVIKSAENRKIIANLIGIDAVDIRTFAADFNRKIKSRNTNNTTYGKKLKEGVIPAFTTEESKFAILIDKLDTSNKGIKDHYPYQLTNLQIMDAIREAYGNARKISSKTINVSEEPSDEDPDAPFIGKQEYEGYSEKYDLVIQFIYNFDYNFIESAWPVRMNNNAKKH